MGELYLEFDIAKLIAEFLKEVPRTPAHYPMEADRTKVDQDETFENEALN